MLRRLRETAPVVLVPLAWTFVTAVHLGSASEYALFIAHLVMATIIAAFATLSWSDMVDGVLLAWRRVLVVGFVITVLGVVGFLVDSLAPSLFAISILGWMTIPAVALAYTGFEGAAGPRVYYAGATLSGVGALVYAGNLVASGGSAVSLVGLSLVTLGQTAGIVNAVYQPD